MLLFAFICSSLPTLITGFTKKIQQQNVTLLSIPQSFRSNALLSKPLRHVLLGRAKISHMVMFFTGIKDYLRISQVALGPMAQTGEL